MAHYAFKSIVGNLVLDSNLTIVEHSSGKPRKAYTDLEKLPFESYARALAHLRDPQLFPLFRSRNTALTKLDIQKSVTEDVLLVQAVHMLGDTHKALNILGSQFREWYAYYNPEFSWSHPDHEHLIQAISDGKDSKGIRSMGGNLSKKDVVFLGTMSSRLRSILSLKDELELYLDGLTHRVCPNVVALTGSLIGAKLLEKAGSLKRLSSLSSQTIQVLGAEKALFRHLRNKKMPPPKYGLLHEHPLIMRSPRSQHGKIARALADKIAIAAKVDYFKGNFVGDRLMRDLKKRFE